VVSRSFTSQQLLQALSAAGVSVLLTAYHPGNIPAAGDWLLGVRVGGTSAVSGSVTATQGPAGAAAWPVKGLDTAGLAASPLLTVGGADVNGFAQPLPIDPVNFAVYTNPISGSSTAVYGANPNLPVYNSDRAVYLEGAYRFETPYSSEITINGTTTVTGALAYLSSLVLTIRTAGTGSTITVQDKSGTPLKLVDLLPTTVLTTTPTTLSFPQPLKMSGGIDVVTGGAVAAIIDIWVTYWQ